MKYIDLVETLGLGSELAVTVSADAISAGDNLYLVYQYRLKTVEGDGDWGATVHYPHHLSMIDTLPVLTDLAGPWLDIDEAEVACRENTPIAAVDPNTWFDLHARL